MTTVRACLGVLCGVLAGAAIADDGKGPDESAISRSGGLLTAPSFQPLDEATIYGSGPYPSVYARASAALVFPFDTEVETATMGDDLELNSKIGVGYSLGAGVRFGPGPNPSDPGIGYRFEGEFAQRFYDADSLIDEDGATVSDVDGDIEVNMIMGNVLFDVTNEGFRGYLGFGAGVAMVDVDLDDMTDSDTTFALQIPFGVEIRVVDNIWIDVGTRWVYIPGLDFDTDIEEFSIFTADLHVGVVVEF